MSDELTRKFEAAWAAVMGGVEWNPGDYDSIGGVTKDEAIEYAAEFLKAYRESDHLARLTAVAEAARALHKVQFGRPKTLEYHALGAALSALDGGDRG